MPPRLRLSAEEAERLPALLARVDGLRAEFPTDADATAQASWIAQRYAQDAPDAEDAPLTLNLITLLLFEHGVHRSADQVAQDLAILREDSVND